MLLTVIWVLETSIGLMGALLVLGDTLAIYRGLKRSREFEVAHNYRVDVLRDALILSGQAINVVIGLIGALAAARAQDGFAGLLDALAVAGLMIAPILLGIISFTTYRSRRR